MANNLKDHLTEVADAIRAKKGTSDLINPQDFATEIEGISGSGGGESGGSNVEYLVMSGDPLLLYVLGTGIVAAKVSVENAPFTVEGFIGAGYYALVMSQELQQMGATVNINAVAFDRDTITSTKQDGAVTTQTAYELLVREGYVEAYNNLPRITKEQFYDLNA